MKGNENSFMVQNMEQKVFKLNTDAFLLEEKDGIHFVQVNEESICALNDTAYFLYIHAENQDEHQLYNLLLDSIDTTTLPPSITKETIQNDITYY